MCNGSSKVAPVFSAVLRQAADEPTNQHVNHSQSPIRALRDVTVMGLSLAAPSVLKSGWKFR
jgi:hypothetical protein